MNHSTDSDSAASINFWPALIDLVTSVLIVFLLATFLQTHLSLDNLEAIRTQSRQQSFLEVMQKEFASEIADGTVGITRTLDFLQITFSDRVLFNSGDYHLGDRGHSVLRRCAQVMLQAGESGYAQIQVEGHTDNLPIRRPGYPATNWELSAARSISVLQFLSTTGGLPPEVFSASGYASYRPVASNETVAGRARNRRIEIRIFFAGQGAHLASPSSP